MIQHVNPTAPLPSLEGQRWGVSGLRWDSPGIFKPQKLEELQPLLSGW